MKINTIIKHIKLIFDTGLPKTNIHVYAKFHKDWIILGTNLRCLNIIITNILYTKLIFDTICILITNIHTILFIKIRYILGDQSGNTGQTGQMG